MRSSPWMSTGRHVGKPHPGATRRGSLFRRQRPATYDPGCGSCSRLGPSTNCRACSVDRGMTDTPAPRVEPEELDLASTRRARLITMAIDIVRVSTADSRSGPAAVSISTISCRPAQLPCHHPRSPFREETGTTTRSSGCGHPQLAASSPGFAASRRNSGCVPGARAKAHCPSRAAA
jgi:hypothetical protein